MKPEPKAAPMSIVPQRAKPTRRDVMNGVLLNCQTERQQAEWERDALRQTVGELRAAAQAVCWFDWSDNDDDAVAAIGRLSAALTRAGTP